MSNIVPYEEINKMAAALGKSGMFGKNAEQLLPLMLIASAEGKHPAIAAQEYDIIQGRPALNSRSALARFQQAGGKVQWLKRSDEECSATFAHAQGGEVTITWTTARAQKAGLTSKDNWKKFPTQMLSARVIAEGVRACFPASLSGFYTTEEVESGDAPPFQTVTGTIIEAERLDDDTAKALRACTSLEGLQAEWAAIPNAERPKYTSVKDEVKTRLLQPAEVVDAKVVN